MIQFQQKIVSTPGNDIDALVSQMLASDTSLAASAAKKTLEAFQKIVKRSMGKTGSTLFRSLKAAIRDNEFNFEQLARYPGVFSVMSNSVMSTVLKLYRPWDTDVEAKPKDNNNVPGKKFANLMQYLLKFSDEEKTLVVGIIPERRGGEKWSKRFAAWQDKGAIDIRDYPNASIPTMRAYFANIFMPLSAGHMPRRPKRDVISRVSETYKPVGLFEKFFRERLLR